MDNKFIILYCAGHVITNPYWDRVWYTLVKEASAIQLLQAVTVFADNDLSYILV